MSLQVVWDILRKEQRREIVPYNAPATRTAFANRATCRSRRVKVWTKEEIAGRVECLSGKEK